MNRSFSRRLANSALYGLGALTAVAAVLAGEGIWTKKAVGTTTHRPPSPDGLYGADLGGKVLNVLVLGDSAAVGYGMERMDHTPPAMLGEGLAHILDRPVFIRSRAVVGAQSKHLDDQITQGSDPWPDVAVYVIGANDVTHLRPPQRAAEELARSIRRLRAGGTKVVVGTSPDIGSVFLIPQPLRAFAKAWSRKLAEAQTIAALAAGARTVSLADSLGDLFAQHPERMYGFDRFHPSHEGYANLTNILLAPMVAAVREVEPVGATSYSSLAQAAHEAVQSAGTEVTRTGRIVSLLRRRRVEVVT